MPTEPSHQFQRSTETPDPLIRWGGPLLLVISGLIAYSSSFTGVFVLDDYHTIVNGERIRHLWPLTELLAGRRPVVDLTLGANYAIGGLSVTGYHAVNLAIHLLAGLTLYGLVRRTLARAGSAGGYRGSSAGMALAVALLWTVHPLQTQSVTYVIQRCESLMGLFYLLTLYCLIRGATAARTRRWYIGGVISCALGFGCKAVMVTAPIVALVYDRMLLARSWGELFRVRGRFYAGLAATWSLLWFTNVAPSVLSTGNTRARVGFSLKEIGPIEYLLTQAGVIVHYLTLAVWPRPLCLDYGWPTAKTVAQIVPAGLLVVLLMGAAILAIRRKPLLTMAGAWFFLILAPTSSIVPIHDPAFEHRMYLPLAAVIAVGVVGLRSLGGRVAAVLACGERAGAMLCGITVAAAALGFGVTTFQRNRVYGSEVAMWQDVVAKRPESHRAQYNFGKTLLDAGRLDEAAASFERAIRIGDPQVDQAMYNLGKTRARQDRFDEAMQWYERALEINPRFGQAHSDIGNILARQGRDDEAIVRYERAIRADPGYVRSYANLGNVLLSSRRAAEAVEVARAAVAIDPDEPRVRLLLGHALAATGALDDAATEFQQTLALDPGNIEARAALERVNRARGRPGLP